jgi:putative radical SAM enzyme (TIGR03279 family)
MLIRKIREGSPASLLDVGEGDELVSLNGRPVRDRVDYRFHGAEESLALEVRSPDGSLRVLTLEKDPDADLGLEFDEERIRECHNKCPFCFVDQSPPGVRKELDIRDDDYLLSFEHGNFVTLTNLKDWEFERIIEQRLSPLYVSVHATDPEARRRLLVHKNAGRIMELLERLAEGGIRMHTQAVICPGWNDGEILDRTIADLAALHPLVETLAVVPVGLTAHREGLPRIDPVTPEIARALLDQTRSWQERFLPRLGTRFAFPSDELFLQIGERVPGAAYYEGYPQEENGVGMTRRFLDEWRAARRRLPARLPRPRAITWVTGTLAAGTIEREIMPRLRAIEGLTARLVVVTNAFYGASVTCAGLLAGADIERAVRDQGGAPADAILLTRNSLNANDLFVDSMPLDALEERLGAHVLLDRGGLGALLRDAGIVPGALARASAVSAAPAG